MDQRSDSSIMEQAQFWVVEVHDPRFSSDRISQAEFRRWLNSSVDHNRAFARWSRTFQGLGRPQMLSEVDLDDCLQRYQSERGSTRRVRWRRWFSAAAAVLLGLILPLVPLRLTAAPTFYMTHVGEQRTFILPDGSKLRLNSGTRVLVQSVGRYREIDVLEGETYVSLAPGGCGPIRVFAATDMITGEASDFDVLKYGDQVDVVAVHGELSVMSIDSAVAPPTQHIVGGGRLAAHNPFSLRAGEMATIRADRYEPAVLRDSRTPAEIERLLAWRSGLLTFSNQSAAEVAAIFNRYNVHQLEITDRDIADLRLSGDFQFNDSESFILALQRVYPTFQIVAQVQSTGAIVLSRKGAFHPKTRLD